MRRLFLTLDGLNREFEGAALAPDDFVFLSESAEEVKRTDPVLFAVLAEAADRVHFRSPAFASPQPWQFEAFVRRTARVSQFSWETMCPEDATYVAEAVRNAFQDNFDGDEPDFLEVIL